MSRKCLAVGVGSVTPVDGAAADFPYLDGAVVAAETIGQWALNSGFGDSDVIVLTDKGVSTVTESSLQEAFDDLAPVGTTIDHFVLSFAGHGLTGINDDTTYWLLNNSLEQGYSIFVEDLRRQLYAYGIHHLTIFSDACRAIANSSDLRGLLPRPGVRKRHQPPLPEIEVARFNACQDATNAFMVKVPGAAAPGKCIFSGVLAEVLWGRVPAAFDGTVIDSSSLGRGLRVAAKERATQYNLTLVPGGSAFFDKVIYFDSASPPSPPAPDLAPWPPAGVTQTSDPDEPTSAESDERATPNIFESVLTDATVRTAILGDSFGLTHTGLSTGIVNFPGLPDTAKPIVEGVSLARQHLASPEVSGTRKAALSKQMTDQLRTLEVLAAGEARKKKADNLRSSLKKAERPTHGPETPRILVSGLAKQIWSEIPIVTLSHGLGQTAFATSELKETLLMVEFADGLFAPVWSYPNLICTLIRDTDGIAAISYRHIYGDTKNTNVTSTAISRLVTGDLSAEEVDNLATQLRHEKHVNPVFGAIAAYCYDVIGDFNSIRRMAAYYGQIGQAAPYDIIFMGLIENNGVIAHVPAVREDTRSRREKKPRWLTAQTAARDVNVAGCCPWLRQGWDFLSAPEDVEMALVDGLNQFRRELTPSLFTTLRQDGGRALAQLWHLEPSPLA